MRGGSGHRLLAGIGGLSHSMQRDGSAGVQGSVNGRCRRTQIGGPEQETIMVEPSPEVIGGYVLAKDGFTYLGIGRSEAEAVADAERRAEGARVSPEDEGMALILVGRRLADAVLDHGMDLGEAMVLAGRTHVPGVPLDIPDAELAAARDGRRD